MDLDNYLLHLYRRSQLVGVPSVLTIWYMKPGSSTKIALNKCTEMIYNLNTILRSMSKLPPSLI